MRTTFIVTSFDILPYIDRCLETIGPCTRPGDRVLVVDDGSGDGTAEHLERRLGAQLGAAQVELIALGTNTIGGVAIAANTGLYHALADPGCEAVVFVDGDDWLEPAGFTACRAAFEASGAEILLGNYLEHDEASGASRRPADLAAWARAAALPRGKGEGEAARACALEMIAVPWRKFYRADFLRAEGLRFPEGNFFYEDNPFHWAVCLKAGSIAFHDRVLCLHRVNRPGQTMAATGPGLAAFFTHFETIEALIGDWQSPYAEAALRWLLTNMRWHLERLQPESFWVYADRAARALTPVPEALWDRVVAQYEATNSTPQQAAALRRGEIAATVGCWQQEARGRAVQAETVALAAGVAALHARLDRLDGQVSGLTEIARFRALRALPHPPAPPQPPQDAG
ncbi:glycosyltransferase family 2 protein [Sinirhodobacter ferrireducens]|uniref:Glycosyltransferase family 2 protein n=1 Tax=Paenirhodobacter ferrireducens TaxID=1215032 RepID=A0A443LKT4_9RHOB|nr:glycosyltransferase family A protein [Sinirhodobacter ferrireducens]RWR49820.1 glycosyltransferase family 2 protein [Sinirhodobacter ferrireducens]